MTTIPDDMVERVARAICERSGQSWRQASDGYREICSDFARAAIEAMQPAILAERERCAKDIANLLEMIRVRNAALEDWENGRIGQ